jgi:hypothetical protein
MVSVVKLLPKECIPDLNIKQKTILLKKAFYELPGGDSEETIQYTLDTPVQKNYISFGFSFTTGQNGFNTFEVKRFKKKNGDGLIIFSRFGGTISMYSQDTLKVFSYINGALVENKKQHLLPQSISINNFLKKETPDSIRKLFENSSNTYYSLDPEKPDRIEFNLSFQFISEDLEKWLLGDSFIFIWNGSFFRRKLAFQN